MRFWLYSTYLASGRTNAAQLGGAGACFRPHLPYGEQLGGAGACFRPHLPYGAMRLGAGKPCFAPGIIVVSRQRRQKNCLPCYETSLLSHKVAQVRKNAGDLRRYKILIFWISGTYLFLVAQDTTKNLHLRHQVIRSVRDQAYAWLRAMWKVPIERCILLQLNRPFKVRTFCEAQTLYTEINAVIIMFKDPQWEHIRRLINYVLNCVSIKYAQMYICKKECFTNPKCLLYRYSLYFLPSCFPTFSQ